MHTRHVLKLCVPPVPDPSRFFETFSYLPSLTEDQIARQVDYIVNNGWTPCLEFADPSVAYMSNDSVIRIQNGATPVSGLPRSGLPHAPPSSVAAARSSCARNLRRVAALAVTRRVRSQYILLHVLMAASLSAPLTADLNRHHLNYPTPPLTRSSPLSRAPHPFSQPITTTTTPTGPCGSSPSSAAPTPARS